MLQQITQDTIDRAVQAAIQTIRDPKLTRAIDLATGLVGVNLQAPAKQLVPLLSPFQQSIPRIVKPGANSDTWRAITKLGSPELFTTERAAGSLFTTTLISKTETFKVEALGGEVTLESQKASEGFDPALSKETANTLRNSMKLEGQAFLFGNVTDLGVPGAPTVANRAGQGTINAGAGTTYFVRLVALTGMAANRGIIDVPADFDGTDAKLAGRGVLQAELRDIALGSTALPGCGMSSISAEGNSGSLTGTGNALKITWSPVAGALAYIVFIGTATGAANLRAEVVIGQTSVTITSLAATGALGNDAAVPAADETGNANHFNGIFAQLIAGGSGAYLRNIAGRLTGTAAQGEVLELQDAFAQIYRTTKIGKFRVVVSGEESRSLTRLGVVSNSMQIFASPTPDGRLLMTAGAHVGQIINATTGEVCPVDVEPWMPPGSILILPLEIPFPDANAEAPFVWVGSYNWMRWDYASTRSTGPTYPFEVRCHGALEGYIPGGCGLLYNVFKG